MQIKLLHLYYDILNLYGDYGNVVVLKKYLEDQGASVTIDKKTIGDDFDISSYNFVFIGAGTERSLDRVIRDIVRYKDDFRKYIEDKKVLLATGNSFEMFGKSIDGNDTLGIFDFETKRDSDRTTSDVIYTSKYFKREVVGFINKSTRIYHNMNPLFKVEFGIGENENNDYEGVKYKNFYGTHLSGPLLARNPYFAMDLVSEIMKEVKANFKIKKIDYKNEYDGYELVLSELNKRKNSSKNAWVFTHFCYGLLEWPHFLNFTYFHC